MRHSPDIPSAPITWRRAFSFTEILFAVMILGIGFIMIAAIFPVAIHQTEDTNRETIGASLGRAGSSVAAQIAPMTVPWPNFTSTSLSSVFVPTLTAPPAPSAFPTANSNSPVPTSLVLPGQVWSFYDSRNPYAVPFQINTSPTPTVSPTLWNLTSKNMIQASDSRFAWVGFYKRDYIEQAPASSGAPLQTPTPLPYSQLIFIGVEARANPAYNPATDVAAPATSPLMPKLITGVQIDAGSTSGISRITFPAGASSAAVAENTYVIISDDGISTTPDQATATSPPKGYYNGRIYRVGTSADNLPGIYYFVPGEAPGPNDIALTNATVYVVGRAQDPNNPGSFAGAAQDVSVYTTFIQTP